jgi:GH15 family glucan-1,4-alpha-glucosidase
MLAAIGDYVLRHWDRPDDGIWEPREGRRHRTHSKALCWTALDRLLELHARGHLPRLRAADAAAARQALRDRIERDGWSERLASYTASFGEERVDAALLQLPWFGYVAADAPRMRSTFRRIESDLSAGRALLHRYRPAPGWEEGAFGICGFWAVEYLAMGGGSADEAEARLRQLLDTANDVGLFAEEVDAATGEPLGNFPQAFTHVGLVNACLTLQERLTGARTVGEERRLPQAAAVEAAP